MSELFIGLMSGTSLDGIDAVLVEFADTITDTADGSDKPQLLCSYSQPIPAELTTSIQQLCDAQTSSHEINLMGAIDRQLGHLFAQAVKTLCQRAGVNATQIKAIGSHGQTIRHYPEGQLGFSLQIGDANTIAVETGIDVIADFRKKDIALGGQGAPLVPAFHQRVFANNNANNRIVVNIGGITNITFLPSNDADAIIGFDTGPGNTLLDRWIQTQHPTKQDQSYDDNGQWARSGQLNQGLLSALLADEFFSQPAPKSTGRERFNLDWLKAKILTTIPPQDVQHTLVHLTAKSLADQIKQLSANKESTSGDIYLCGGGSRNAFLVSTIAAYLPQFTLSNTDELGVNPDWVEAIAFAWLARAYTRNESGNIPAVTGASRAAVLGCYFPAA